MLSRPLKHNVPKMQSQGTNESSHHLSCHFHLTKQWIQWEILLGEKKELWACTKTIGESILCLWCWEQNPSGRWCTHTFVHAGTHWLTCSMLPQRHSLFCLVLKSSQHRSSNNFGCLFHTCSYSLGCGEKRHMKDGCARAVAVVQVWREANPLCTNGVAWCQHLHLALFSPFLLQLPGWISLIWRFV